MFRQPLRLRAGAIPPFSSSQALRASSGPAIPVPAAWRGDKIAQITSDNKNNKAMLNIIQGNLSQPSL